MSQSREFEMRVKNSLSHPLLVSNYRISLASVTNALGLFFCLFRKRLFNSFSMWYSVEESTFTACNSGS